MSIRHLAGVALLLAAALPGAAAAASDDTATPIGDPAHAIYGDRIIDLSKSWEGAGACIELTTETRCYTTIEEQWEAHPEHAGRDGGGEASLMLSCSPSVILYGDINYGGGSITLTSYGTVINLSGWGFDNVTSSYWVNGSCNSTFYANAGGGGGAYPGNTSAGAFAASMAAGWNDRVSSVLIW